MPPTIRLVNGFANPNALRDALTDADTLTAPVLIEIQTACARTRYWRRRPADNQ
jgi:hypothetical protein